jgi:predicted acetyltransferase
MGNEITVRAVTVDEMLEILYWLSQYSFHPSPPMTDKEEWAERVRQRLGVTYYALFAGSEPQACAAGTRMTQNIRGSLYPMAGIWGVITHPAARREGYSRRVLMELLGDLREQGIAFSCLYPFRESFYERLGYVTLPLPRIGRFEPRALTPLLENDLRGEIELGLSGEKYDQYWAYLDKMHKRVHGMALFDEGEYILAKEDHDWLALAVIDGEVAGLMRYQLVGERVTQFTFKSYCFYYDNSAARYLLLNWIARHIDQADQVELWLPPYELPETWYSDIRVKTESQVRAPMGRILDITRINGQKTGPGKFSARISDPICPWNESVWQFESIEGRLSVTPAVEPDCTLSIQALNGLVFGAHDPGDFAFRGWGNPSGETQVAMRSLFPPQLPYLHSYF